MESWILVLDAKFASIELHNNSRISFFLLNATQEKQEFYKSMLIWEWVAGGLQFHMECTYTMYKNLQLNNTAIWAGLFEKEPEHYPWGNWHNICYLKYIAVYGCYSCHPHPVMYFTDVQDGENLVPNSWSDYLMCWTAQSMLLRINPKHCRFCINTFQKIPTRQCLSGYFFWIQKN